MSGRALIALILGVVWFQAASGSPTDVVRYGDAQFTRIEIHAGEVLLDLGSSLSMNIHRLRARSLDQFEKIPLLNVQEYRSNTYATVQPTAFNTDRLQGTGTDAGSDMSDNSVRPKVAGELSDQQAMTALDALLMLLVAVALVAYQLGRKQRMLEQYSLTAVPH